MAKRRRMPRWMTWVLPNRGTITQRISGLVALPIVALVLLAVSHTDSMRKASVRGDSYKSLKLAQDLVADTNPPSGSLLEAWSRINHIGVLVATDDAWTGAGRAAIDVQLAGVDEAEDNFTASMAYWAEQDIPQEVQIRLLEIGGFAGEQLFAEVETKLKPAIEAQDSEQVLEVIRSLEWRYEAQDAGVREAIDWAIPEVESREESTNNYVIQSIFAGNIISGVIVLITIIYVTVIRRSITRPINALVARARAVAEKELPDAVNALQAGDDQDQSAAHLAPFDTGTNDELAEIAASFNAVQNVALDLAGEQATARRVVSQNLTNIARRNQNLLGRTLGFISSLEEGERDPEALDNLFRLDHLTTRMRRNAQSLLVLAGAEPTRLWSPPVALGDVVRAALSEVENYGQVELAELGEVGVVGSIASDVAHLLAELLENATSFSPPTSPVTVVGRAVPDGHQLAIFDYGLGMTPEELADANRRMGEVAAFDRETTKMLGFQVVARLADRHGIKVMLTTTPGGSGVTAVVRLPASILEPIASPGTGVGPIPADVGERLSEPLPTATAGAPRGDGSMATTAVLPPVEAAAPAAAAPTVFDQLPDTDWPPVPAADSAPVEPTITDAGLTRRVRGAQMPELGTMPTDTGLRPADDVRNTLASLQRGIDRGRQRGPES